MSLADFKPEQWLDYLAQRHDAELEELEVLNQHYEGTQALSYMHPEVFREVSERIQPVILGWPLLIVDAVEERLDLRGFRLPDEAGEDKDLRRVWQANGMDEQSQMAHVDALVMKRAYVTVGSREGDTNTPILAAESPLEMFADVDPRTRKIRAALRRVNDDDNYARMPERSATLYLPNATVHYGQGDGGWKEEDRDEHKMGEVPVVALVNRPRLSSARLRNNVAVMRSRYGRSEISQIIPLSDAANKIATDMMLGAEALALPVRGFFGIGPEDLVDEKGNQLTQYQALLRKFLMIPVGADQGAKEFVFPGANLSGFHDSMNALAERVAALAGLPAAYLGFHSDNPASADAIRSAESRLVKRAERKQTAFGGAYEQMCRIVRRFQSGEWDPKLLQLETRWRDASTPTVAQTADAAVKKYATPGGLKPIATLRQTREDCEYTDAQIRRMEREDDEADRKAAERDPMGVIARGMTVPPPTFQEPVPVGAGA